jgi:hypothetical protein
MGHRNSPGSLALVLVACLAWWQPGAAPRADGPPAVVELLEDDTPALLRQLNNDGGGDAARAAQDFGDFYSGVCSVRVTPFQRFASRLRGWGYQVAEKPGPGQYRYLRFAWKRLGGPGIMIQLHGANGSWNQRYLAGQRSPTTAAWGPVISVADQAPTEWTVVTRDLFQDFGPLTITGLALTPMEGGTAGLFDHVYLGRSVADLDRASAAVFGAGPPRAPLTRAALGQLWRDLASRDVAVAGQAVRTLVAGRKESVAFLEAQLRVRPPTPQAKRLAALIAELDDNRFRVREAASRELEELGEAAVPLLQEAVRASASTEVRRRARQLLERRGVPEGQWSPEQAGVLRAIRVLEWSGTPEARRVLQGLSGRTLEAGLADQARRAWERLRPRP